MRRTFAVWLLIAAAGCSVPVGTLSTLAVAPPPSGPMRPLGPATGRSCRWWVLGLPLGIPRLEEAAGRAIAMRGGAVLRDARVSSDHPVWLFVGRHCYTIEGEVYG